MAPIRAGRLERDVGRRGTVSFPPRYGLCFTDAAVTTNVLSVFAFAQACCLWSHVIAWLLAMNNEYGSTDLDVIVCGERRLNIRNVYHKKLKKVIIGAISGGDDQ